MEILQKQSEKKKRKLRFEGLVNTYLKLLEHEKLTFTCCKDIRNLYDEIVLKEVVADDPDNAPDGEFFRKEGTEVISATGKVIHKGLYPEKEIISAMEYALNFLNDDSVEKLFRISIFHYMLEYIHPFYDGNGRLGRLILSYGLMETLNPMVAFRISETIKENIKEYYDAFVVCNDRNNLADLTPFLIMMLQMIKNALKVLEESLQERLYRWNRYKELVFSFEESSDENVRLMYDYLIQASLFGEKGMSTQQMENLFKTYYLFKSVLNKINPELLITEKYGKHVYYRVNLDKLDSMSGEKV
ncbi:MAG: Fic family protein [Erysipelotrichaceae bacterium]|nr:Fic family protein [Erysipelotrichaceae bacterium]